MPITFPPRRVPAWFWAEVIGTFILVFLGCGAVATSVALDVPSGLFQVAAVWGLGLATAIFVTGAASGAHLNPAITIAFAIATPFPARRVPGYVAAQFAGAFLAAAAVYALFGPALTAFESTTGIIRGTPGSEASAMVFGDFFPNPGGEPLPAEATTASAHARAFFAEFLGTSLLALAVFGFIHPHNPGGPKATTAFAIGTTLTALICVFAPLTMAGFNPARDLAPRLFSSLAGWGSIPFTANGTLAWLTVYLIAPCLGAPLGALAATRLYQPTPKPVPDPQSTTQAS